MSLASVSSNLDIANMALQMLGQPTITTLTESSRDAGICNQLFAQNRDYVMLQNDWPCLIERIRLTRSGSWAISGITKASPAVVTCATHTLVTGEVLTIEDVSGMTQINDNSYVVRAYTSTTISLNDPDGTAADSSGFSAWTSGGYVYRDQTADHAFIYDLPADCYRPMQVLDATGHADEAYTWERNRSFIYTDVEDAQLRYVRQSTDPTEWDPDLVSAMSLRLAWLISMRIHTDKDLRSRIYGEMEVALKKGAATSTRTRKDPGEPERTWLDSRL
jgi:hypothetical protein